MKYAILFLMLVGLAIAAPVSFKNEKAMKAKSHADAAQAQIGAIKASPDYATYTNIVKLLNAANNWGDAKPLLIKYISIKEQLDDADATFTGKKDKVKSK